MKELKQAMKSVLNVLVGNSFVFIVERNRIIRLSVRMLSSGVSLLMIRVAVISGFLKIRKFVQTVKDQLRSILGVRK